jgi:transmembrane sensor
MIREVLTLEGLSALPNDEAAALLAARTSDRGGAGEEPLLVAWLELDPDHGRAWRDVQRALSCFADAGEDPLVQALRSQARRSVGRQVTVRRSALAAAAVIVVVAGALWLRPLGVRAPGVAAGGPERTASVQSGVRYATDRHLPANFTLADGSVMTLDAQSAVTVAFSGARRDVRLVAGRAGFDVRHDSQRPFVVAAGDREIVAVGTRFDVSVDPRGVQVVLAEGRLAVTGPTAARNLLEAGQMLSAATGGPPVITVVDLPSLESWRRGLLAFDDERLATAAAKLNRYGRQQLLVTDSAVASLRVSGTFRAGDPERFAQAMADIHPVRVIRRGPDVIELVPAAAR